MGWQYSDKAPKRGIESKGVWKKSQLSTNISLYLRNMQDKATVTKANRNPHQSLWTVPVWMTLSDLQPRFQGHDIIQRQITQKRYKTEQDLQWQTNRKSYGLSNGAIYNTLNNP